MEVDWGYKEVELDTTESLKCWELPFRTRTKGDSNGPVGVRGLAMDDSSDEFAVADRNALRGKLIPRALTFAWMFLERPTGLWVFKGRTFDDEPPSDFAPLPRPASGGMSRMLTELHARSRFGGRMRTWPSSLGREEDSARVEGKRVGSGGMSGCDKTAFGLSVD